MQISCVIILSYARGWFIHVSCHTGPSTAMFFHTAVDGYILTLASTSDRSLRVCWKILIYTDLPSIPIQLGKYVSTFALTIRALSVVTSQRRMKRTLQRKTAGHEARPIQSGRFATATSQPLTVRWECPWRREGKEVELCLHLKSKWKWEHQMKRRFSALTTCFFVDFDCWLLPILTCLHFAVCYATT